MCRKSDSAGANGFAEVDDILRLGKWDLRFMAMADMVATWSKDPSTQVGCVLVDPDRHIIATGYNGFPRGVADLEERLQDRSIKYDMVLHAEANAVLQAVASTRGATAYVTHQPCANCTGILIQAGIARVVTRRPDAGLAERFAKSFEHGRVMMGEASILLQFAPSCPETPAAKGDAASSGPVSTSQAKAGAAGQPSSPSRLTSSARWSFPWARARS